MSPEAVGLEALPTVAPRGAAMGPRPRGRGLRRRYLVVGAGVAAVAVAVALLHLAVAQNRHGAIGSVMRALTAGIVTETPHPDYATGDAVTIGRASCRERVWQIV